MLIHLREVQEETLRAVQTRYLSSGMRKMQILQKGLQEMHLFQELRMRHVRTACEVLLLIVMHCAFLSGAFTCC